MYWERVSEEIYLFTSDRYALVNSVAVVTQEGIVVIDALPFPEEAKQIVSFRDFDPPSYGPRLWVICFSGDN